jgi:hypothetical protein
MSTELVTILACGKKKSEFVTNELSFLLTYLFIVQNSFKKVLNPEKIDFSQAGLIDGSIEMLSKYTEYRDLEAFNATMGTNVDLYEGDHIYRNIYELIRKMENYDESLNTDDVTLSVRGGLSHIQISDFIARLKLEISLLKMTIYSQIEAIVEKSGLTNVPLYTHQ